MKKTLGIFLLMVVILVLTGLYDPAFISAGNVTNMIKWSALYGILALGVCFVITTGGIDLSMGSMVCLVGVIFAMTLVKFYDSFSVSMSSFGAKASAFALASLIAIAISVIIGIFHGILITKVKLQPFVVTLCGLFIYRGLSRQIANDQNQGLGSNFDELSKGLISHQTWIIPSIFFILVVFGVIAAIFLNKTTYGRYLLALGRNEKAAKFSGIKTDRMIIMSYIICACLAGIGAIFFVFELKTVQPSIHGNFYELYAIAGAVLGGCSLRGGECSISGVICGAALVEVIKNAVFFLGVDPKSEFTIIGIIILLGVAFDEILRRFSEVNKAKKNAKNLDGSNKVESVA